MRLGILMKTHIVVSSIISVIASSIRSNSGNNKEKPIKRKLNINCLSFAEIRNQNSKASLLIMYARHEKTCEKWCWCQFS